MRVRVELRRNAGEFIARFRKQTGFTGQLVTLRKIVQDRQFNCLTVLVDDAPGYPGVRQPGPELFESRITEVTEDEMRLMGWEAVDHAWHVQEWDCFFLR